MRFRGSFAVALRQDAVPGWQNLCRSSDLSMSGCPTPVCIPEWRLERGAGGSTEGPSGLRFPGRFSLLVEHRRLGHHQACHRLHDRLTVPS